MGFQHVGTPEDVHVPVVMVSAGMGCVCAVPNLAATGMARHVLIDILLAAMLSVEASVSPKCSWK